MLLTEKYVAGCETISVCNEKIVFAMN